MIKELSAQGCNPIFPVALAAAFVFFASIGVADAQSQKFQFAVIGDTGYSKRGEQEFEHMMAAVNREPLTFVVHVGDFEADPRPYARNPDKISMPCTDESFARARASFNASSMSAM